jgi:hypothetical protein
MDKERFSHHPPIRKNSCVCAQENKKVEIEHIVPDLMEVTTRKGRRALHHNAVWRRRPQITSKKRVSGSLQNLMMRDFGSINAKKWVENVHRLNQSAKRTVTSLETAWKIILSLNGRRERD